MARPKKNDVEVVKSEAQLNKELDELKDAIKKKKTEIKQARNRARNEKGIRLWNLLSEYLDEEWFLDADDADVVPVLKAHLNGEKHPLEEKKKETKVEDKEFETDEKAVKE